MVILCFQVSQWRTVTRLRLRQINDAINRLAELEEERKKLTQVQQEEWERFAWGN
jgi:hypothetical protein